MPSSWPVIRVACVWLPLLPLRVAVLRHPAWDGRPLVLGRARGQRQEVHLCSPEAARAGIRPGLPLREVVALCRDAIIVPHDPVRTAAVLDEVLVPLQRVSPAVELADEEYLFLDLRGLKQLYRGDLAAVERAIRVRIPPILQPRLGVAGGKFTASVAARLAKPSGMRVVPQPQTAAFLAPLPIHYLPFAAEALQRLSLLGLRRIGDLVALPVSAVQAQFGPPGVRAWRLATGQDDAPVVPHPNRPVVRAALRFDDPLASVDALMAAVGQLLEVAIALGDFTAGQADQFRRSMSRRRSREAMERFRTRFLEGARQRGLSDPDATALFDQLCGFSAFGFPKSHAYAFAILAYQSAWLRHYYPAEYFCALLNNQPMGFYAPHVLLGDLQRRGLQVLPVAINRSGVQCTPGENQILLGLTTVKGIGTKLARAIVAEREARGPYRSLRDLLQRTGLPRAAAEHLIAIGACSEFGLRRREFLWQLGLLLPQPVSVAAHRADSPVQQLALALPTEQDMVPLQDMTAWERLVADYGLLGLSPRYHPLGLLRPHLPGDVLSAEQLKRAPDGRRARTAGMVVCRQRPGTAKGFVFLLLEDETGLTNVVVSPAQYEARRSVIRGEPYLWIEGTVQKRAGTLNLLATRVVPLARLPGLFRPTAGLAALYPCDDGDCIEAKGTSPARPVSPQPAPFEALQRAALASDDFH